MEERKATITITATDGKLLKVEFDINGVSPQEMCAGMAGVLLNVANNSEKDFEYSANYLLLKLIGYVFNGVKTDYGTVKGWIRQLEERDERKSNA